MNEPKPSKDISNIQVINVETVGSNPTSDEGDLTKSNEFQMPSEKEIEAMSL